ncbi:MAG: hypothetical protein QNJ54_06475 [Prochloraceae cyanobacterium]|nr:hypothetical protein [Prochloraceae cyanobacterium]
MTQFILSPRYRLDDQSPWLEGIDPSRQYWIFVNGDTRVSVVIPGLNVSSLNELKEIILRFRSLQPKEEMTVERIAGSYKIQCISSNCYAVEGEVAGAETWHLFDRESLESLLMTSHPDWQPAPEHIELGRRQLAKSFQQPAYI